MATTLHEVTLSAALGYSLWSDEPASRRHAAVEAADTGSTVLQICSIEIQADSIQFIGTVPTDAVQMEVESSGAGRTLVRPQGFGKLHTTCGTLICPMDPIGFLVLHHPVKLIGGQFPEEAEFASVAVKAPLCSGFLPLGLIGVVCCIRCNEPIPQQRLQAIPGVRSCTKCQNLKEKKNND